MAFTSKIKSYTGGETGLQSITDLKADMAAIDTNINALAGVPAWDAATTFAKDDLASSGGSLYQSLQAGNLNHPVTDNAWWTL